MFEKSKNSAFPSFMKLQVSFLFRPCLKYTFVRLLWTDKYKKINLT